MRRLAVIAFLLATGCSTTQVVPDEQALTAASRRLDRACQRASDEAWGVPGFATLVRYNPAPCDCPAWEARLAGDWVRVELRVEDPDDESGTALLAAEATTPTPADLTLTDDVVEAENGWRYPVVAIVSLDQTREGRSIE